MEVAPEWHVRMQAAWQENIDSSISKTVNLPYQSTVEDVENIYLMPMNWELSPLPYTEISH